MVRDAPFYSQIVRITHTNHASCIVYSQLQGVQLVQIEYNDSVRSPTPMGAVMGDNQFPSPKTDTLIAKDKKRYKF